ncbi:MAG: S24 family peptidase [Synergistaceae bacterium]
MLKDILKTIRKDKKITQDIFAKEVCVSVDTVRRWESGEREPRYSDLQKIAKALNTSVAYLMGEEEKEKAPSSEVRLGSFTEIPVLDISMAASCGAGNGLYGIEGKYTDTICMPVESFACIDQEKKPFGIHIDGDSMEGAGLADGSIAVINPAEDVINGDIALVSYNDSWFIKWVVWTPSGVELRSANPNYTTVNIDTEYTKDPSWFRIIGKVVEIVKKSKPKRAF